MSGPDEAHIGDPRGIAGESDPILVHRLADMVGGWFVGAFEPAVLTSSEVEVGVKHYRAGDTEALHLHKLATEVTLIATGRARMAGRELGPGDILVLPAGHASAFEVLEDCTTVVVKSPSAPGDKYLVADQKGSKQ